MDTFPDHENKSRKVNHIQALDGLRGLAAFMVVYGHMSASDFSMNTGVLFAVGNYGVLLFFVLSGFLMGYIYIGKEFTLKSVRAYLVARVARIVPLYYITILSSFFAFEMCSHDFVYKIDIYQLVRSFLFFGSASVFWSIGPEFQFYVLFIGVWFFLSQKKHTRLSCAVCLVPLLIGIFLIRQKLPGVFVFSKLHIFLFGVFLGMNADFFSNILNKKIFLYFQSMSILFIFLIFFPVSVFRNIIYSNLKDDILLSFYYQDFAKIFMAGFIVFSFCKKTILSKYILSNRIITNFGKFSFSVYLLHFPILWFISYFGIIHYINNVLSILFSIAVIYFFSFCSFYLIEAPLQRLVKEKLL
ncbi:acyltransferase family protein [Acetobacter sp.]|uniref:acyltransferase family protein n=1 Tax=Acetobacter sp. TaxID=440 RepID=UPI0025BDF914|nr:acyltransferase [Acetobacter sp.]MCH4090249.1 acyltransferase [Acetobacter sp.]MCI1298943.1 acyltransferase [Acetobacter sp.]MCI1314963.1 acyltransferase [Acetobacter sp.]